MPAMDFCNTMEFPLATLWIFVLQLSVFLSYNKHIKDNSPTKDELTDWHTQSKLPIKRFWNTSGQLYRELGLSRKVDGMTEKEQITVLATDGMLVKRPILIGSDFVQIGFKESEWEQKLAL
jgi:arsenate reductase